MSDKYEIEATDYGMRLAFKGFASPEEIAELNRQMERTIVGLPDGFGVIVDMRENRAFPHEVAELMKKQIDMCKERGMGRGAIVLQSAIMTLQARRITSEAGISPQVRFLDASADPKWEQTALEWISQGVEPPARVMGGEG
ncbi:MAG: hypothetical protein ACLF0P_02235 [Thermoanaerobaculia bacterium]